MGFFKRKPEGESEAANNGYYWCLRGKTEFQLGRYEGAETSLRRSLDYLPDSVDCWIHLASARSKLNQVDQAIEAARSAIELKEDNSWAWSTLGVILIEHSKFSEFDELVQNAKGKGTEIKGPWTWWASALFGRCDFQRAENVARSCIAVDPKNQDAWLVLGWSLARLGRQSEAESAFTRCISLDSGLQNYDLEMLAQMPQIGSSGEPELKEPPNFDKAKYRNFISFMKTSIDDVMRGNIRQGFHTKTELSGDPELWLIRADMYFDVGKYQEAENCLKKALQKNPGKPPRINPAQGHPNANLLDARGNHLKGRARIMFDRVTMLMVNGRMGEAMMIAMQEKELEGLFLQTVWKR